MYSVPEASIKTSESSFTRNNVIRGSSLRRSPTRWICPSITQRPVEAFASETFMTSISAATAAFVFATGTGGGVIATALAGSAGAAGAATLTAGGATGVACAAAGATVRAGGGDTGFRSATGAGSSDSERKVDQT